ncbi:MAG: glycoside hydrolase family 15 protein, partial [Clostridiaceae bacterium]
MDAFWRWAAMVQDADGSWQQRYHLDGNLAPSWGLQIDEGGSIIRGILKHYEYCGNKGLLIELWPCVRKGVGFLMSYIDPETGLPWLSFDLWEERLGEHAYSTAAVCAGIEAGARIAEILGSTGSEEQGIIKEQQPATENKENAGELQGLAAAWREAATGLRAALEKNFWKPDWNRFVRSVRVKLNGWGEEHTSERVWLKQNGRSAARDFT